MSRSRASPRISLRFALRRRVAGECGEDKREIVYFGDTVNLTARIEGMCKALGRQVVALISSGDHHALYTFSR